MKQIITLISAATLLFTCSPINKIITVNDEFKNEKSIRLIQYLKGYSDEGPERIGGLDYWVTVKTVYSKPENQEGIVTAEFTIKTESRPEELDSLIFLEVDQTKYKLYSHEYASRHVVNRSTSSSITTSIEKEDDEDESKDTEKTSTTTQVTTSDVTLQIMKRTVEIPRDIWHEISRMQQIRLRLYIATEGITVHFSSKDRRKFAELFQEINKFERAEP
ncbi:hypothetical protein SAMN05444274_10620 [Mariniphaga anaerophila]|uniref:Uncharacterized protein n=1 Tax=Mariniphaga anaerophila TaxID=1484053 RepID=A0A1M5CA34_9BACT|nr:hypothetical protein [Mariniphaga anaerophila]SHF51609.1 hypothetical protein SAMN05444274_10620 [Mariniphaga anaerophila]